MVRIKSQKGNRKFNIFEQPFLSKFIRAASSMYSSIMSPERLLRPELRVILRKLGKSSEKDVLRYEAVLDKEKPRNLVSRIVIG